MGCGQGSSPNMEKTQAHPSAACCEGRRSLESDGKRMAVSVVIVNFNSGTLLTSCVRSVLASRTPLEVFVSDNASTDNSISQLRQLVGNDSRVRIVENETNLGFARGNNVVLPLCRGDYVLFLNPDCIIQPDTLERMVTAMYSHPQAGMAGCLVRNPDGSEQAGCRRF